MFYEAQEAGSQMGRKIVSNLVLERLHWTVSQKKDRSLLLGLTLL